MRERGEKFVLYSARALGVAGQIFSFPLGPYPLGDVPAHEVQHLAGAVGSRLRKQAHLEMLRRRDGTQFQGKNDFRGTRDGFAAARLDHLAAIAEQRCSLQRFSGQFASLETANALCRSEGLQKPQFAVQNEKNIGGALQENVQIPATLAIFYAQIKACRHFSASCVFTLLAYSTRGAGARRVRASA